VTNDKPGVLIVGAGAMGLIIGYHLSLAGSQITFLVRPQRLAELATPQRLYNYRDGQLRTFSDYRAVATTAEIDARSLDYVLLTLDGSAMRTVEGSTLLKDIGAALQDSSATLMFGGVGVGLREHVVRLAGLPSERILSCALGLLAHQVAGAQLPIHPPTRPELLAQAHVAYVQGSNKRGLVVAARPTLPAKNFRELYNRCGVSRCQRMNSTLFEIVCKLPYPLFAISELAGWPRAEVLAGNKSLWQLNRRAQGEIMSLRQHGWIGRLIQHVMTERVQLKVALKMEHDAWPMDLAAFNRFHHGKKVQQQNIEIMRDCIAVGERDGSAMSALKEVLDQLERHTATKTAR
jgi:Ketopantoate reductase PanE/ApbA